MLKIAICDDEKFFKIKIEKNIEKYLGKEEIAYEVDSFDSGIQLLEKGENIAGKLAFHYNRIVEACKVRTSEVDSMFLVPVTDVNPPKHM